MELSLIPLSYKSLMRMVKKVSIYTQFGAVALLLVLAVAGFFRDATTAIVCSLSLLVVTLPLLIPGLRFEKVSQSSIRLTENEILICDKSGACWRTIKYSAITAINVQEISGFFYGQNKDMFRSKYVCVYLNGATNVPDVSFEKLFLQKDFFMFSYNLDALRWLQQKHCLHERQSMVQKVKE